MLLFFQIYYFYKIATTIYLNVIILMVENCVLHVVLKCIIIQFSNVIFNG